MYVCSRCAMCTICRCFIGRFRSFIMYKFRVIITDINKHQPENRYLRPVPKRLWLLTIGRTLPIYAHELCYKFCTLNNSHINLIFIRVYKSTIKIHEKRKTCTSYLLILVMHLFPLVISCPVQKPS